MMVPRVSYLVPHMDQHTSDVPCTIKFCCWQGQTCVAFLGSVSLTATALCQQMQMTTTDMESIHVERSRLIKSNIWLLEHRAAHKHREQQRSIGLSDTTPSGPAPELPPMHNHVRLSAGPYVYDIPGYHSVSMQSSVPGGVTG